MPDTAVAATSDVRRPGIPQLTRGARVDGASLAVLRMAFGVIALWEVVRYFENGWIIRYWVQPDFHFTYHGLGWVTPLPSVMMHVLWVALGVAAAGIALGYHYRLSCVFFALGFGYSFLLEAARYLNHFYLIVLLAILLAVVPAHRVWSLDARRHGWPARDGVPAWALWLLRFQVGVVYVYGGIAKLDADWLRGEPMRTFLAPWTGLPGIGPWLADDRVVHVAAWGSLVFDLVIVFAVLWLPTRIPALFAAAMFHLVNGALFQIGVFPYLAFAALLLFCDPAWPRAAVAWLRGGPWRSRLVLAPPPGRPVRPSPWRRVALGLAAVWVAVQLLVPLRHLLYPGVSNWTEQGHVLAWHMKLRSKSAEVAFTAVDPRSGERIAVDPLDSLQPWQYEKMAIRPEMIREFAHHVAEQFTSAGRPGVQVYATARALLNGRPPQPLVDPTVDLAAQPRSLLPTPWIVPLRHNLPGS